MYFTRVFLSSCLVPIVTGAALILGLNHSYWFDLPDWALLSISLVPGLGLPFLFGWAQVPIETNQPAVLFRRYLPLLTPLLLLLVLMAVLVITTYPQVGDYESFWVVLLAFPFITSPSYWLGFVWKSERRRLSLNKVKGALAIVGLLLIGLGGVVGSYQWVQRNLLSEELRNEASIGHGVNTADYWPFYPDNRLAQPAAAPGLRIAANYPRLDGAIALLPVYGAAAQALYEGLDANTVAKFLQCRNTTEAFERLLRGEADIFFGAPPSEAQREEARTMGLDLTETPLALEAFVFLVNRDNPVESLSLGEIRDIYSKRLTSWKQVGGRPEKILAFQRPANSGSQTAMERLVMRDRPLSKPLVEEGVEGMGDLVLRVADYRNRQNALGYSFRWYATNQYSSPDIKFLAIDGIRPEVESIRDESYPLSSPLVAVTVQPLSQESQALIDWLLGPEGQDLVGRVGYVPLP